MIREYVAQSQYTAVAGTGETTIVTADPNFGLALCGLIITTPNAVAATLTLREATAGATRAVLNYPNAAAAPSTPLIVQFDPPIVQPKNANWTLQASVNASGYNVTALYAEQQ